jgi:hypothetical protein
MKRINKQLEIYTHDKNCKAFQELFLPNHTVRPTLQVISVDHETIKSQNKMTI